MIRTKKELDFYIQADFMMNRGYFKPSLKQRIRTLISPDYIIDFLVSMRRVDYYSHILDSRGSGGVDTYYLNT